MIPYDPEAIHVKWYNLWRVFIKSVHLFPGDPDIALQACTAQAWYVMALAIEMNRIKKENSNASY